MRVFVTGATGFIGTLVVGELLAAGHHVTGLARSDASADALAARGVAVHRGVLEAPETLAEAAATADGIIHLAYDHDFARFEENGRKDNRVVEAMLGAIRGTGKPFVLSSGVNLIVGKIAEETDRAPPEASTAGRGLSEAMTLDAGGMVVRLPQVHDTRRQGLITPLVLMAMQRRFVGYAGDGANGFSAAHVTDVARLYRLALEGGRAGSVFHAVDEAHVPMRAMAEAIGEGLGLPVRALEPDEVAGYFGPLARFAHMDNHASSALTRQALGWTPTGPGMLDDLRRCAPDV